MGGILDVLTSFIGSLLYPMFSVFFQAIDGIQYLFFAFAGIETSKYGGISIGNGNTGSETDTGIVYYLMNHPIVKNMLVSISLLALFLLVVFTVLAIIKNAYSAKPKSWKEIVGNSLKGLTNFVLLPVCALLGVWAGNILLQAINGATSAKGSSQMSRKLFIASAYNANVLRNDNWANVTYNDVKALAENSVIIEGANEGKTFYSVNAAAVDRYTIKDEEGNLNIDESQLEYYAELVDQIYAETNASLSGWHFGMGVDKFYQTWSINYLVLIVAGIFMLYVLGSLAFAMVRRLFLILMLFMISPGMCAMYPLDEGAMAKKWRDKFKEQVLSAYGAVAGLNLFFALLPLIEKLEISGWPGSLELIRIFVLVTGLMLVKEFISFITSFVGGEDAYGKGSALMKSASKEVLGRSGKVITGTVGAFGRAVGAARTTGLRRSFWSSLGRSAVDGLAGTGMSALKAATGGAIDIEGSMKAAKDGYKTGVEAITKKREKQITKDEYKGVELSVKKAIEDAAAKGIALTDDQMAKILDAIKDKGARTKAAEQFAQYQNQYNSTHHPKGHPPKGVVTAEKILESGAKSRRKESAVQDAFGAFGAYDSDYESAMEAGIAFSGFNLATNMNIDTKTGEWDGLTGTWQDDAGNIRTLVKTSGAELESLRISADRGGAAEIKTYQEALHQNDIIAQYEKLFAEKKAALDKLKSTTLGLATRMEALAETQSDKDKALLIAAANDVKKAVNKSGADYGSIKQDVDTVLSTLGRELQSLITTGAPPTTP